ncbi:MAG: hypothetical protein KDG55_23400, partial [Rhodocyclaceae bacterium]|nr:hypothetical protein [Rhodocyclaceae bacterium]
MTRFLTSLALVAAFVLVLVLVDRTDSRAGGGQVVGNWTVLAWNDLGMHCMDSDYSVFSILPPFNTVRAQLIDDQGDLVTAAAGITVTYEAVADPSGSINKSSIGKTNFWQYANALYGSTANPNEGIAGHDMPGPANQPQPMTFSATESLWHADG